MAGEYVMIVENIDLLTVDDLQQEVLANAAKAVNRTTDWARTRLSSEMRQEVNFLARYLADKMPVVRRASAKSLQAEILGRFEATMLARFAVNKSIGAARKRGGVPVQVAPGTTKFMRGAFLMNLRNDNLGLVIRLKDGETVRNKRHVKRISSGLYLLYAPSVNQVFRGVTDDNRDAIADYLEREFRRLMGL